MRNIHVAPFPLPEVIKALAVDAARGDDPGERRLDLLEGLERQQPLHVGLARRHGARAASTLSLPSAPRFASIAATLAWDTAVVALAAASAVLFSSAS